MKLLEEAKRAWEDVSPVAGLSDLVEVTKSSRFPPWYSVINVQQHSTYSGVPAPSSSHLAPGRPWQVPGGLQASVSSPARCGLWYGVGCAGHAV